MAQREEFLYEFLYRGRKPSDPEPPAFQITVAEVEDPTRMRTLNVSQAKAEGIDVDTIMAALNLDTLTALESAQIWINEARAKLEGLEALTKERDSYKQAYEGLAYRVEQARAEAVVDSDGDGQPDDNGGLWSMLGRLLTGKGAGA